MSEFDLSWGMQVSETLLSSLCFTERLVVFNHLWHHSVNNVVERGVTHLLQGTQDPIVPGFSSLGSAS